MRELSGIEGTRPVRVGLLGYSSIARRKFIPALRQCEGAVLTAVARRTPEWSADFSGDPGCTICRYEELLSRDDVDLIYLSLPNHLHEEWTLRALRAGKHVLCEKPLGLTLSSVERMLAEAEAVNRLLYESLMFLHHPQHAAVRSLITTAKIGRLLSLRCVFGMPMPAQGDYRRDPACGGGAFWDLARYPLGLAGFLMEGALTEFSGFSREYDGLNLAMHGTARSSAGEILQFAIAFGQSYEAYYEVIGELGKIRVDRAFTTPADLANRIEVTVAGEAASFTVPAADHFRLMLDHVCALLKAGGDFLVPAEHSRQLARLAAQMEQGCPHGR